VERRHIGISTKKPKAKPVERATPTIGKAKNTDADKVNVTSSTTVSMKASPSWATAPATVQAATTGWSDVATSLGANATTIVQLKDQLATAEAKQRSLRVKWTDATRQVLGTIAVWCDGSTDMVHGLGLQVLTRQGLGPLAPPSALTALTGAQPGDATVKWARGNAHHGFLVQHATDVATLATYSVPVACTKSKYTLTGATSLSIVHFRVAAIDPSSSTGQTAWSDWIAATVR
jgi:hypothetical protein